jgi:hypothetical protein
MISTKITRMRGQPSFDEPSALVCPVPLYSPRVAAIIAVTAEFNPPA